MLLYTNCEGNLYCTVCDRVEMERFINIKQMGLVGFWRVSPRLCWFGYQSQMCSHFLCAFFLMWIAWLRELYHNNSVHKAVFPLVRSKCEATDLVTSSDHLAHFCAKITTSLWRFAMKEWLWSLCINNSQFGCVDWSALVFVGAPHSGLYADRVKICFNERFEFWRPCSVYQPGGNTDVRHDMKLKLKWKSMQYTPWEWFPINCMWIVCMFRAWFWSHVIEDVDVYSQYVASSILYYILISHYIVLSNNCLVTHYVVAIIPSTRCLEPIMKYPSTL